jgi:hypothetical protein
LIKKGLPNIPANLPNIPANLPNIPANLPNIPANLPNIPANLTGIFNIKMNRSIFQLWKSNKLSKYTSNKQISSFNNKKIVMNEFNLSCIHSFKKPNNLKEIYNSWDIFINWSINNGNSHLSFTINLPPINIKNYFLVNGKYYVKDEHGNLHYADYFYFYNNCKNILKLHPIYKNTDNYKEYNKRKSDLFCDPSYLLFLFRDDIHYFNKLISWEFITTEENENGILHLHGIISYKNLIDFNKNIKNNILNNIKFKNKDCDVVLKDLNSFKDIKGWIQYLHKDKILIFPPKFKISLKYEQFLINNFYDSYNKNYNIKNKLEILNKNHNDSLEIENLIYFEEADNYTNIQGIILNKNEINENIFIDLILNYLLFNDYFLFNDIVYEKIKDTLISYKKIGTLKEIVFDGFEKNIILYFLKNFPCQFIGFDFYFLIKTFKNKMENNILKIKNLSTNKIILNFSYLEFNDGIYDLEENKFINKKNFFKNNLATIKYYNKSYSSVRQNKPNEWICGIKNALGKNNIEDFTTICLFIASFFQKKSEDKKKNFLYIHGESNTGKTTYLTKVLTRYYGFENVGSIVNSTNFKFQDLQNKLLVVMDEFKYSSSSSTDFLKLLGGEQLLTTQKYSKDHIVIDKLMGLILSNYLFIEKNDSVNKALQERLYIIKFLYTVDKNSMNINENLKNEEANIIIFCNKLYFSFFGKKSTRIKKLKKKSNQKHLF